MRRWGFVIAALLAACGSNPAVEVAASEPGAVERCEGPAAGYQAERIAQAVWSTTDEVVEWQGGDLPSDLVVAVCWLDGVFSGIPGPPPAPGKPERQYTRLVVLVLAEGVSAPGFMGGAWFVAAGVSESLPLADVPG